MSFCCWYFLSKLFCEDIQNFLSIFKAHSHYCGMLADEQKGLTEKKQVRIFSWNCFHSALVPFCQLFAVVPFCSWFPLPQHFWLWLLFLAPWQSSTLELQQSSPSPVCCSHCILLEVFLPAACTSFSRAAFNVTEGISSTHMVRAFQPTQCAAVCTHGPGLQAPLPADTWAAGSHLETWQRWQQHFEHSKKHANASCIL